MHSSLADWAWRHVQEGKAIDEAVDVEIKEPCYVDEMCHVFKLGLMCTESLPSRRPSMKEVVQILLRRSRSLMGYGEKLAGSEYDAAPLLKNSKRERDFKEEDDDDASFANIV